MGQEPGSAVSSSLSHLLSWIVLGLKRATNKDLSLWSARTKDMAFIGGFSPFQIQIRGGFEDLRISRYKLRRLSYDKFFGILLQDKNFSFEILNSNWKSDKNFSSKIPNQRVRVYKNAGESQGLLLKEELELICMIPYFI